jgi:signal transduction histidine kinase
VGFEEELRVYLEHTAQPVQTVPATVQRTIDEHALRAYFLARLRALEHIGGAAVVEQRFRAWSPRLPTFARYIAGLPALVAPVQAADAQAFAERALEAAMAIVPWKPDGIVEQLELERIAREFQDTSPGRAYAQRYSVETTLVRDEPRATRLTPLAVAFLRLRGKDAVRWLLTCEVMQSTGRWDRWRTPRMLLEQAIDARGVTSITNDEGYPFVPFDAAVLSRLVELGVLHAFADEDGEPYEYRAAGEWHEVIRAVLAGGPWHHTIAAILAEDRTGLVAVPEPATERVVEQTKLIAHEVRNALIPARMQLESLRSSVGDSQMHRLDAVRRGVVRVLSFVDEMVATSELIADATTACDLAVLIHEAIGSQEESERIQQLTSSVLARVRAPRAPLVRAISNVLRNALQATSEEQRVSISTQLVGRTVRIVVDDGGPGVPQELRERVFQEGYTTRGDGTGYGLAYVRRVVADGLRGRVWCEASDLGGARFVIELPDLETE